jgi:hypothetical protein
MDWYTIAGGGDCSGGPLTLSCTIGQPETGTLIGNGFELVGGYWDANKAAAPCYANCDGSTAPPILNANDFQCFLNRFAAGDPYANCDGSTTPPVLNANDFQCFLNSYAAGCS